ncbi:hypothetical protein PACTADRAFT_50802 [Pachysolen tannophilus NRRL Y-2460]|uniref:Diacylglycerol O-acyltransferase n=1 Tax=Pachysolen tannophilus NRRL Y-2460 TaxID=669874 RepID=A0A1E4TT91_PACTA|nr:hypothetical protein PACTADRAFT_50802 [Pachysolen tannophilus NRRL Y-2460]
MSSGASDKEEVSGSSSLSSMTTSPELKAAGKDIGDVLVNGHSNGYGDKDGNAIKVNGGSAGHVQGHAQGHEQENGQLNGQGNGHEQENGQGYSQAHGYGNDDKTFAPLLIPLERRLQTLALVWHTCTIPILTSFFFLSLAIPQFWPLITIYLLFYFFWDETASNGEAFYRRSDYMRNLRLWKYYVDYFPIKIHKTCDLEPTFTEQEVDVLFYKFPFNYLPKFITNILNNLRIIKVHTKTIKKDVKTGPRYIFGYHPHGVISLGITGAVASNGAGFEKMFPGIKVFLLTLANQFKLPIHRDYLLSLGISSVSKHNVMELIRNHDASVCIVVGGASESLLSVPGRNDIVLNKRKGFIKIALELGDVVLVPIYGFGETDIYEVFQPEPDGKLQILVKFQLWLKKHSGFTVPFFHARGIFNYDFGLLPYRKNIDIVFGRGIKVPFRPSPTIDEINHYHGLYVNELKRLFDANRERFGAGELRIVS